ncbi:hypothetical protein Nepgr_010042 [Nepenthes gracilis]|uniref:Uncharacterized protein n=1 Tax=Nepenthes gracilis TaxID=150966 RepID=A0AAD3XKP6_NEPGR|nr:hypothetical protein Nepgr_010042 [Nepenthes gracilis]
MNLTALLLCNLELIDGFEICRLAYLVTAFVDRGFDALGISQSCGFQGEFLKAKGKEIKFSDLASSFPSIEACLDTRATSWLTQPVTLIKSGCVYGLADCSKGGKNRFNHTGNSSFFISCELLQSASPCNICSTEWSTQVNELA